MKLLHLVVALIATSIGSLSLNAEELLYSFPQSGGIGSSPGILTQVEVLFGFAEGNADGPVLYLGKGVYWDNAESGYMVMNQATPGFDIIAEGLTNGRDDTVFFLLNWAVEGQGGGGTLGLESFFRMGNPDLMGNEITSIRTVVNSVYIEPWGNGYSADVDATVQIYGHPIPEPVTIVLLLGAASYVAACGRLGRRTPNKH